MSWTYNKSFMLKNSSLFNYLQAKFMLTHSTKTMNKSIYYFDVTALPSSYAEGNVTETYGDRQGKLTKKKLWETKNLQRWVAKPASGVTKNEIHYGDKIVIQNVEVQSSAVKYSSTVVGYGSYLYPRVIATGTKEPTTIYASPWGTAHTDIRCMLDKTQTSWTVVNPLDSSSKAIVNYGDPIALYHEVVSGSKEGYLLNLAEPKMANGIIREDTVEVGGSSVFYNTDQSVSLDEYGHWFILPSHKDLTFPASFVRVSTPVIFVDLGVGRSSSGNA